MKRIDKIIPKVVKKQGINQQAEAAYICHEVNKINSTKFEAVGFRKGTLYLQVKDSLTAQDIQFQQKDLIKKINQRIGSNKIERIRFKIKM